MQSTRGRMYKNTSLTHGDKVWVEGDLKCTFNIATVTQIDNVTNIIVNRRYFPNKGTTNDVGGIISASSKKNTVSESKIEMLRATFSQLSEGK